jgi:excisionase family DNA binding protein
LEATLKNSFADYLESLDSLLSVSQVADLLGVHHDTIYRWVRSEEMPVLNIGTTKRLLRFVPKDLAVWVCQAPHYFHGPYRAIADWMEQQILRRGIPRVIPPLLPKVFQLTGYDWLSRLRQATNDPAAGIDFYRLLHDFTEAVKKLSVGEQRQLLADIRAAKSDEPIFPVEDVDVDD